VSSGKPGQQRRFKFAHSRHALQFAIAPQGRGQLNHALFKTCRFIATLLFWQQDRAVVGKAEDLACLRPVPVSA